MLVFSKSTHFDPGKSNLNKKAALLESKTALQHLYLEEIDLIN
jgi:hypothetical protein